MKMDIKIQFYIILVYCDVSKNLAWKLNMPNILSFLFLDKYKFAFDQLLPQLCDRYELSSASLQKFYITFMYKIALQSHCLRITLSMTQLFGNLLI